MDPLIVLSLFAVAALLVLLYAYVRLARALDAVLDTHKDLSLKLTMLKNPVAAQMAMAAQAATSHGDGEPEDEPEEGPYA